MSPRRLLPRPARPAALACPPARPARPLHPQLTLRLPRAPCLPDPCPAAEQKLMLKERASGMYRLSAFYLARTASDIPSDLSIPSIL